MFLININIVYFVLLSIVVEIQSLVELPAVEDNSISTEEAAIRATVNNLFAAFRIKSLNHRLKQYSTIHNFFASITLTDCDNLKQISRLTRVNDVDNNTIRFIALLNEVLDDDGNSDEENESDVYVTKYIEKFINKLKYLKETYDTNNKNAEINAKIIKYIDNDRKPLLNITKENNISKSNDSDENDLSDDDDDFWHPNSRRIYKGIRTRVRKFPFMASVQFFKKFQCAGSIIHDDLVITSASCLQLAYNNRFFRENPAFLSVQVGSNFYEGSGDNIAVLEVYFYPTYDPKTLANNLAIMRLTRRIAFRRRKRRVKMIDIDRNPWQLPENTDSITVVGWGAKDSTNIIYDPFRQKLSFAELDFYPLSECREHYSKEYVTKKNFCAGFFSKGSGACNRDAGGPGIVDGVLMGVISFGSPVCGAPDSPTVFTKLGFYADWIDGIIDQYVPHVRKRTTTRRPKSTYTFYSEETTTRMKLTPVFGKTTQKPLSILDMDSLRTQKDEGFKDFLSTMFESDELKEYLNKPDVEIKKDQLLKGKERQGEVLQIDFEKTKKKEQPADSEEGIEIDMNAIEPKSSPVSLPTIVTEKSVNLSTTIKDESEDSKDETIETATESEKKITVIGSFSDHDETLEEDIMSLIDNLDIEKLLKEETMAATEKLKTNQQKDKMKQNIVIEGAKSDEEKIDLNANEQAVLNFLFLSKENENADENNGIVKQEFKKDLTLRDFSNNTQKQDVLSERLFYDLVALAIEEERNRLKERHDI